MGFTAQRLTYDSACNSLLHPTFLEQDKLRRGAYSSYMTLVEVFEHDYNDNPNAITQLYEQYNKPLERLSHKRCRRSFLALGLGSYAYKLFDSVRTQLLWIE